LKIDPASTGATARRLNRGSTPLRTGGQKAAQGQSSWA
ncbi:hypothetical protein T10_7604, partial [Trichinella papuae]